MILKFVNKSKKMVKTITLAKIAGIGGFALATTGFVLQSKLRSQVYTSDLYKSAMKTLRAHPGAIQLLGEPMKERAFKIDYDKNFCDGANAKFQIPINGAKQKGVYYFWAKKIDETWVFTRAELGLDKDPSRRLVIIRDTQNSSDDENS